MTSTAIQEVNPPRASWVTSYGKYLSSAGPQVEGGVPGPPFTRTLPSGTEEEYLPRPYWVTDPGCPHPVESRGPRAPSTGAPAFAMEDDNWCGLSWLTNTGKYPATTFPRGLEDRAFPESSTEALMFAAEDGNLRIHPWDTKMSDYPFGRFPLGVESRVPIAAAPGAPVLVAEDGNLRVPPWIVKMRRYPTTVYSFREEDGAPQMDYNNLCGPPLVVSTSNFPTDDYLQIFEDIAPKQICSGTLISALKKRDVHRAISMTNSRIMNFKREILRGQAVILQAAKSKSPIEENKPLRSSTTGKKERVPGSPQRGSQALEFSASEVGPSIEGSTVGLQAMRAKCTMDQMKFDRAASTINTMQNTFSGSLVEGKAIEKPTAWPCPAAKENKPCKGKVSSKETKTVQFDLSPTKAAEPLADRGESILESRKLPQDTPNTKEGHKVKTCPFMDNYAEFKARFHSTNKKRKRRKRISTPLLLSEQILKGRGVQLLNTPLARKMTSSQSMEDKLVETTKTNSSADDDKQDRSSSKITKRVKFDPSTLEPEEPAIKHLVARDKLLAKVLKWYKATIASSNAHKSSNLPKAKGRTTRHKAARVTTAAEGFNQDGATLLSNRTQQTKSLQFTEATALEIQAPGTKSTAQGTKQNETTSSTKIMNQTVSRPKITDQPTGPLAARANSFHDLKLRRPPLVTNNIYLTIGPPETKDSPTGLSAARGKTKENKQLHTESTTKLVYQTLRLGPAKLLPVRVNPEDFNTVGRTGTVCDLEVTGTSHTCIHLRVEKPQELTKLRRSKGECPVPHSSHQASTDMLDDQQLCPGEHVSSKDIPHCPRRHLQSSNISHKNKCSKPKQSLKLNDNLKEKTIEAHKMIDTWEKEIQVQEEHLQEEEIIFVRDPDNSCLEYPVTSNEPY